MTSTSASTPRSPSAVIMATTGDSSTPRTVRPSSSLKNRASVPCPMVASNTVCPGRMWVSLTNGCRNPAARRAWSIPGCHRNVSEPRRTQSPLRLTTSTGVSVDHAPCRSISVSPACSAMARARSMCSGPAFRDQVTARTRVFNNSTDHHRFACVPQGSSVYYDTSGAAAPLPPSSGIRSPRCPYRDPFFS